MQNISECTFPGCFLGVSRVFPGSNFLFSFTLLKIPTTFAKEVFSKPAPLMQNISECTFPGCFLGVSRVFPGCFPGVPGHDFFSFTLLKIPTTFAKGNNTLQLNILQLGSKKSPEIH